MDIDIESKAIVGEDENVKKIRFVFGSELSDPDILKALSQCQNNPDAAINFILDTPGFLSPQVTVKRTVTSTGARISGPIKQENDQGSEEVESVDGLKPKIEVKEQPGLGIQKKSVPKMSFDEFLVATNTKVMADDEYLKSQIKEEKEEAVLNGDVKMEVDCIEKKVAVKGETEGSESLQSSEPLISPDMTFQEYLRLTEKPKESKPQSHCGSNTKPDLGVFEKVSVKKEEFMDGFDEFSRSREKPNYNLLKASSVKKERVEDRRLSTVVIEDGDFPEDPDWLLVGRTTIMGLSTTKGRKLENNEIVHFAFPSTDSKGRYNSRYTSAKATAAATIVRFSTKRSGELGRLPMEWAKCLIPLVNSSKVKVLGRCIAAPLNMCLMQEILLYVSFYIHHSIFTDGDKSSWKLDAPSNIDSTVYPLLTLFKLLKTKPFQKAEFTPEELDSRKRSLNLHVDSNEAAAMLPIVKRQKGCQQYPEQTKDEQAISESSLNKLVGAVDVYNLEEMEPPHTLMCDLRPYQKQALYWMSESEKGVDVEKAAKTLHPCWAEYRICDERATAIYVNIFSGEATTQFPTAMEMARGGILADAMGLGKTVMTIALILARPGRGSSHDQKLVSGAVDETECIKKKTESSDTISSKVKGGTLIICPMALLSQWKDAENSIFRRMEWYRVVLDEAHTIKSSRTQGAQVAFTLSSHCRWCLTGTPLQEYVSMICSKLLSLKTKAQRTLVSSSPSGPAYTVENSAHQVSAKKSRDVTELQIGVKILGLAEIIQKLLAQGKAKER